MLSKREKVLIAVLGSILLHCIILLLFGLSLHLKPAAAAPAPEDKPITLTITKEEPPQETLPVSPLIPTPPPPMVDNQETNAPPPPDARFESNANSAAAAELAATGAAPVPTQEGKQIPEYTFDTHQYTVGDKPAVNSAAQPPPQEQQPPDQQEPPQPSPPPKQVTAPPPPKVDRTAPRPPPTPAHTPPPVERDLFALLGPTPTPHPEPKLEDNHFDPTRREPLTEPPRPTPAVRRPIQQQPPREPGYQPMTQKAAMSGSISNKGPASVAALGTPMGRYKKAITDAIGSRWYYYMGQHADVASFGTVKIHFIIDRSGAALRPQVTGNTGNSTLENVSLQAITEATIPPMPPEVAEIINSNQLEFDFSFSLVDF